MASSTATFGLAFFLLVIFSSPSMSSGGTAPSGTEPVFMNITNNLGEIPLSIRCQSKDDDIGTHVLNFHDSLKWTFTPRQFIGGTLFFCSMRWNDVFGSFDVYDQKRDVHRCAQRCWWSILQDGAYFYDEVTEMFELMYAWR